MMQTDDHSERDEALLAELRGAMDRLDPVPDAVTNAARAAVEFRDLDAQIAELLRDSATEKPELAGVRGSLGRLLTFGLGERYIEVEIVSNGNERTATGYVVPAASGAVVAESGNALVEAELDEHGRFHLPGLSSGPIRLRLAMPEGLVLTPWTGI